MGDQPVQRVPPIENPSGNESIRDVIARTDMGRRHFLRPIELVFDPQH
jgi:hypothetical protein